MAKPPPGWSIDAAADLYGIDRWGNDYFGLNADGHVTARTLNTQVPLLDIVEGMRERDLQMPVLLRIENILDAQLYRLTKPSATPLSPPAIAVAIAVYTR